jgi:hypothetical protein
MCDIATAMGHGDDQLLFDLADTIGLDADRFRLAQGASSDQHFLTGIELALGAAVYAAVRYLRGFRKGVWKVAETAGLDPAAIGERDGEVVGEALFGRRIKRLEQTADKMLVGGDGDFESERPAIAAEIEDIRRALTRIEGQLPIEGRSEARGEGLEELARGLEERGFERDRSEQLAERLEEVLFSEDENG